MKRLLLSVIGCVLLTTSAEAQNSTRVNTELPDATTTTDDAANPTVPGVRSYLYCWDAGGSNWDRCTAATSATPVLIRSDNTDNDDETQVKATAGTLLYISGRNSSTTVNAFVRCTNATAASTTPGSTAVIFEMMLPFGGGFIHGALGPDGMTFSTALTCYVATGIAVSDATDAAQDEVVVNIGYR